MIPSLAGNYFLYAGLLYDLFQLEIGVGFMSFDRLSAVLRERVREMVRNGEFTERGLARFLGVSQPHMHNILNGARKLTPEMFDTILKRFNLDLLDLFPRAEIDRYLTRPAGRGSGRESS